MAIRYLKTLARMPLQTDSWLGVGHTISSNDQNEVFSSNSKFCSILLLNATNLKDEELDLRLGGRKKINFYQLFPLYLEELEYKIKHDASLLLKLFDEDDLIPVVNIKRKNYCEKE